MSKQKREKFTATVTPEKTRQDKTFVQVEGKLTEEQLEAIAGGSSVRGKRGNILGNHNETMVTTKEVLIAVFT